LDPELITTEVEGPEGPCRIAVTGWGDPGAARTIVCVHGLTRNARDFDVLARDLAQDARVLAVDVPGRGRSAWFADPKHYDVPVYAALMSRLLDKLGLRSVDWIGTSLGGLIGMRLAAPAETPIARLVLNDIGPTVPTEVLEMIRAYLGLELSFATLDELEQHLRQIHAPFGPLSDADWRHLAIHSSRQREDGRWVLSYDPAIRIPFAEQGEADFDEWPTYDAIRCPTLLIRGKDSLVLTDEILAQMRQRGPRPEVVAFEGIGHAPTLTTPDQVAAVRGWLLGERLSGTHHPAG
jgi:pimeloyl-ACP methyl ester carboxylesterase